MRKQQAKDRGRRAAETLEFWFRRKYNLPPTDPRFLSMSVDDMLAEYWAHRFYDDPKAADEVEDETFDLDEVLRSIEDGDWEEVANGRYQDPS